MPIMSDFTIAIIFRFSNYPTDRVEPRRPNTSVVRLRVFFQRTWTPIDVLFAQWIYTVSAEANFHKSAYRVYSNEFGEQSPSRANAFMLYKWFHFGTQRRQGRLSWQSIGLKTQRPEVRTQSGSQETFCESYSELNMLCWLVCIRTHKSLVD